MSQEVEGNVKTFKVGAAALTGKMHYLAKLDSDGNIVLAAAATDAIIGVIQDTPLAGESVPVLLRSGAGTAKVIAAGVVAIGAKVTSDSSGKVVSTTTDKDEVVGIALEAAGADGDIIEVMLANYTLSHA